MIARRRASHARAGARTITSANPCPSARCLLLVGSATITSASHYPNAPASRLTWGAMITSASRSPSAHRSVSRSGTPAAPARTPMAAAAPSKFNSRLCGRRRARQDPRFAVAEVTLSSLIHSASLAQALQSRRFADWCSLLAPGSVLRRSRAGRTSIKSFLRLHFLEDLAARPVHFWNSRNRCLGEGHSGSEGLERALEVGDEG